MHVTDAQQLAFKIYQTETINLSTSTLCLQISPHNDVIPMSFFFWQLVPRFSAYPLDANFDVRYLLASL